ncbi:MAG: Kelch repeat-containing protein, partial [Elusimicrobiota bacterium]
MVFSARAGAASWTGTTSLPDSYNGHAMVYASGRLYHTGGISLNGGILDGIKVFFAPISPSGTAGAWTPGPPLPEAVFYHASAAAGGFVYVLGGYHYTDASGMAISDAVYYAKVDTDGGLGAWQSAGRLPQPVFFPSAAVWNGRLYVTGGCNGSALTNAVYSAVVNPDGSLGSWTAQKPLPVAVYTHTEVSSGTLYVLGGTVNGGADIQNAVYFAKINADGTLADWAAGSPLPQPVANHAAVLANGRVFVLGGWTGSAPTDAVESASVAADGSLGLWSSETSLPRQLYLHAAATDGSYVYISGGNDPSVMRAEVYS